MMFKTFFCGVQIQQPNAYTALLNAIIMNWGKKDKKKKRVL